MLTFAQGQCCPPLSAFLLGARNREKGGFSRGQRGELRTLEREMVPGQLSGLQSLLPSEL